jgi:hypothetical protein
MSRCTGHCCKAFYLPYGYVEILRRSATIKDGAQIASMVIPLPKEPDGGYRYTCKWFDAERGDCSIYEDRPHMCYRHPEELPCDFPGCTRPTWRRGELVGRFDAELGRRPKEWRTHLRVLSGAPPERHRLGPVSGYLTCPKREQPAEASMKAAG